MTIDPDRLADALGHLDGQMRPTHDEIQAVLAGYDTVLTERQAEDVFVQKLRELAAMDPGEIVTWTREVTREQTMIVTFEAARGASHDALVKIAIDEAKFNGWADTHTTGHFVEVSEPPPYES